MSQIHNSVALKNLLKYCMMSGWDFWDVMVVLKHQHDGKTSTKLALLVLNCSFYRDLVRIFSY